MRIAILGAGVMGRNIARTMAGAGHEVALYSRSAATLSAALDGLQAGAVDGVHTVAAAVRGAEVVIESVPESLELKVSVLRAAQAAAPAGAVIASNTSSLPLGELGASLRAPDRFLGWHWFNPAHLVPLVEVVMTPSTDPGLLAWSVSVLRDAGKTPIEAPAVEGFLVNRLQYALIREALALIEAGLATAEQIDAVVTACLGPRWAVIGPMQATDLAGLSTAVAVARQLFPGLSAVREPQPSLESLVTEGRLGASAGRGFFPYPDGGLGARERRDRGLAAVLDAVAHLD